MIAVTVTDDGVLDLPGIQSELLQSACNFLFDRIIEDRVDNDDALRGRHGPGRVLQLADEVQVVENLLRIPIPLFSRPSLTLGGRGLRALSGRTLAPSGSSASACRVVCGSACRVGSTGWTIWTDG